MDDKTQFDAILELSRELRRWGATNEVTDPQELLKCVTRACTFTFFHSATNDEMRDLYEKHVAWFRVFLQMGGVDDL